MVSFDRKRKPVNFPIVVFQRGEPEYSSRREERISNPEIHDNSYIGVLHWIQIWVTARGERGSFTGHHFWTAKILSRDFPVFVFKHKKVSSEICIANDLWPVLVLHVDYSTGKPNAFHGQRSVIGNDKWA